MLVRAVLVSWPWLELEAELVELYPDILVNDVAPEVIILYGRSRFSTKLQLSSKTLQLSLALKSFNCLFNRQTIRRPGFITNVIICRVFCRNTINNMKIFGNDCFEEFKDSADSSAN